MKQNAMSEKFLHDITFLFLWLPPRPGLFGEGAHLSLRHQRFVTKGFCAYNQRNANIRETEIQTNSVFHAMCLPYGEHNFSR